MNIVERYPDEPTTTYEVVDPVSMTVPDQTYSVRELFERMRLGLSLDKAQGNAVEYDDDPDIDNPDPTQEYGFDISDAHNMLDDLENRYNTAQSQLHNSDNVQPSASSIHSDQGGEAGGDE